MGHSLCAYRTQIAPRSYVLTPVIIEMACSEGLSIRHHLILLIKVTKEIAPEQCVRVPGSHFSVLTKAWLSGDPLCYRMQNEAGLSNVIIRISYSGVQHCWTVLSVQYKYTTTTT